MYILFFKTELLEKQRYNRYYFGTFFEKIEDAIKNREKIIKEGFNGEKITYTSIKEGKENV